MLPAVLMSLLTETRLRLSPSSPVSWSEAMSARVEAPSGASHFTSPRPRWNGEVQMARWSRAMFAKKRRSRLGVGDGVARGAGLSSFGSADRGLCAYAPADAAAINAQNA